MPPVQQRHFLGRTSVNGSIGLDDCPLIEDDKFVGKEKPGTRGRVGGRWQCTSCISMEEGGKVDESF